MRFGMPYFSFVRSFVRLFCWVYLFIVIPLAIDVVHGQSSSEWMREIHRRTIDACKASPHICDGEDGNVPAVRPTAPNRSANYIERRDVFIYFFELKNKIYYFFVVRWIEIEINLCHKIRQFELNLNVIETNWTPSASSRRHKQLNFSSSADLSFWWWNSLSLDDTLNSYWARDGRHLAESCTHLTTIALSGSRPPSNGIETKLVEQQKMIRVRYINWKR